MFNKILKTMGLIGLGAVIVGAGILIGALLPASLAIGVGAIAGGGAVSLVAFGFLSSSEDADKKELESNNDELNAYTERTKKTEDHDGPDIVNTAKQKKISLAELAKIVFENKQEQESINQKNSAEMAAMKQQIQNQGRDISNGTIAAEKSLRQKQPSVFDSKSASPSPSGLNTSPKV